MELSQKEKDRIIAETKVRFEATRALESQSSGACGHGRACGCGRGGFWKGLFWGVLITLFFGFVCRHTFGRPYGMGYMGACPFSSGQSQNPADTPAK
jgi:hypothetical protein